MEKINEFYQGAFKTLRREIDPSKYELTADGLLARYAASIFSQHLPIQRSKGKMLWWDKDSKSQIELWDLLLNQFSDPTPNPLKIAEVAMMIALREVIDNERDSGLLPQGKNPESKSDNSTGSHWRCIQEGI